MVKLLTKREQAILFITLGLIVFYIAFNFLLEPVLNKNQVLSKKINITKAKLEKYRRLLSQKEFIQDKYNKASVTYGEAVGEDTLVGALSELEVLAKDANIRIIDIRPQARRSQSTQREVLIDLKAEGGISGYLKFIYNIENSLSLLKIKKFQLSAKPHTSALEGVFSISRISVFE